MEQRAEEGEVLAKTGRPTEHWMRTLEAFKASRKPVGDSVAFLQEKHGVPRAWARTLTAQYLRRA